jgi:hypothetical protein
VKRALAFAALLAGCVTPEQVGSLPEPDSPDAGRSADASFALACTEPLPCYAPLEDRVSLCGQLHDVETGAPLRADGARGGLCDPLNPTLDGPCSVCANVFETAALVAGPGGAPALDSASVEIDDCGRYRVIGAKLPDDGALAIMTGNCALPTSWRPTVVSLQPTPGSRTADLPIYATSRATDERWTSSAAQPFEFGETFIDVGAYLVTYLYGGEPSEDVTLTVSGRPTPLRTFYFDDEPALSVVNGARVATSVNGSALAVGTDYSLHGGVGGEPDGCVWPSELAASIPGVLFVQRKLARRTSSGEQCAPGVNLGTLR